MSRNRIILIIASVIAVIIIVYYGVNLVQRFFQIDACLDRGGRWNYELNKCENSNQKHQYISLTTLDMYLLNKDKDFSKFKSFHIWQRNDCLVFDYYNDREEKRYLLCEFEDTLFYKIIFSGNDEFIELDLIGNNEYVSTELYWEFKNLEIDELTYVLEEDVFFLKKDGEYLIRSEKSIDKRKRFENYSAIDDNWYYLVDSSDKKN